MRVLFPILFAFLLISGSSVIAQNNQAPQPPSIWDPNAILQMERPSAYEINQAPGWAKAMYGDQPNALVVDQLYKDYFRVHTFTKSYHTQYYKRWRRWVEPYLDNQGVARVPNPDERAAQEAAYLQKMSRLNANGNPNGRAAGWNVIGPKQVWSTGAIRKANQTNVYSLDQSPSDPSIMFCGTEPGEIYKSTDGGSNWNSVSENALLDGGVSAIEIHPANPGIIVAGSGSYLYRSNDGGLTWNPVHYVWAMNPNEILFNPNNPNIVLAATQKGLFRSTDGGLLWNQLYSDACYDLKWNVADPAKLYLVKSNPALTICEFLISSDTGSTFTVQSNGWYSSNDPARSVGGARIAVTQADSNRVYAYLIGESKANDFGFIGIWRSDDGGVNWTLPNPPVGGPYSNNHPNTAYGNPGWTYHQGFYNCAIMASNTDPDKILIGGLNLWRSDDGGLNYSSVAGYIGGPLNMHVDNQDFRAFGSDYWISTDGGIFKSSDFFTTQPTIEMTGVHGSDYWGFGSGWNEDVLVGGLYHNGNATWYEPWLQGDFMNVGGGEAATGYVNPGENTHTYFSDVGGKVLPGTIGDPVANIPFGMSPNEAYWAAESSELEFYPHCYNMAYLGKDNKLWKTEDGGGSFNLVYTFGANVDDHVKYVEISRSNPEVIYLNQQPASGSQGKLWRTANGGQTWSQLSLPPGIGNSRKMLIAVDPEDENTFWVAFPDGNNGSKIFKSTNGGQTWLIRTTLDLNGESAHSIVHVGGTDGGIYYCSQNTIFYRDDNMPGWLPFNSGLPLWFNTNIARPFYRDGKLRAASYGRGIWESEFYQQPARPIATAMVNQLSAKCDADTFYFECYSMLNQAGASWLWNFPTGTPTTTTQRNPAVVFSGIGQHMAILTVTDSSGQGSTDSISVEITGIQATYIAEDFENNFPPLEWETFSNGSLSWAQSTTAGGFGNSPKSAFCDNYNIVGNNTFADLRAAVNLNNAQTAELTFDVSYSQYGVNYSDTLEVLVSTDCGFNFTQLYRKGGQDLATAPNFTPSPFIPTAGQWRTDTLDLSAFIGNTEVVIAFRNVGGWGQFLYLDNINLNTLLVGQSPSAVKPEPSATLAPNPVLLGSEVVLVTDLTETFELIVSDMTGKSVFKQSLLAGERFSADPSVFSSGTYFYTLFGKNHIKNGKLVFLAGQR